MADAPRPVEYETPKPTIISSGSSGRRESPTIGALAEWGLFILKCGLVLLALYAGVETFNNPGNAVIAVLAIISLQLFWIGKLIRNNRQP